MRSDQAPSTQRARFHPCEGLCSSGFMLALLLLVQPRAAAATFGLDYGLPGPSPGRPKVVCKGAELRLGNAALSMSWTVTPDGLKAGTFSNLRLQQVLPLNEAFTLRLTDGRLYPASQLAPHGRPRITELRPVPQAARLADRIPGRQVDLDLRAADGLLEVTWRAVIRQGANYIRQEIEVRTTREDCAIQEVIWLDQRIPGARLAGWVDGSPLVVGHFFLGAEDPHAKEMSCKVSRGAPLRKGEMMAQSFVMGVAPQGQLRRGFLYYLERERAHPYRPFLHYNSWYDIAWNPFTLNETNCLEAIQLFGERFIRPHHVTMDAMVFDDGWDNPQTLWQFHTGFPDGFTPLARMCQSYGTHLGVWLSPFGGYGEPRNQRLKFGHEQGYETNAAGFSLAGPKYYEAFKQACVGMIRNYGVNHFKFDGIASGAYANGSAEYILDTQAMRRLMLELRQEDPNLYINLTTGSWPSPFWLRYADSLWRQGGDMGLAGKGSKQQQWLTYRDQEIFRNIVGKGPLFPLNSLMTQGVAYSRLGSAGEPTFNSEGFKDDVCAFFGSGTSLQELYIQPGKLTAEDWRVLAEAARWSRANADVLVDTHWVGGDPSKSEVYGFASWAPHKGIVMLRNPDDRPQPFGLDAVAAFELPAKAPTRFSWKIAWKGSARNQVLTASPARKLELTLKPFEVLVLEATLR